MRLGRRTKADSSPRRPKRAQARSLVVVANGIQPSYINKKKLLNFLISQASRTGYLVNKGHSVKRHKPTPTTRRTPVALLARPTNSSSTQVEATRES